MISSSYPLIINAQLFIFYRNSASPYNLIMRTQLMLIIFILMWVRPNLGLGADEAVTGKIVMLKGIVNSTARPDSQLHKGDTIQEGDTITTGPGSLVKIEFSNNSTIFVGPESSMKLDKMENGKANIISLLKGQLQSRYSKGQNSDYKAVVKTPTAALGVRGTHFLMLYNPVNKVSSAVTFTGHVAFMKMPERWNDMCSQNPGKCGELMIKGLDSNTLSRVINEGELSQAFVNKKTATIPTQMNRVQFFSLLEHSTLQEEGQGAKAGAAMPKVEGENGAPKAGGMLDLKTGLYIEANTSSIRDPKTGHFLPVGDIGQVDLKSGEYKPPQGWELKANGKFEMATTAPGEGSAKQALDPNHFAKVEIGDGPAVKEDPNTAPPKPPLPKMLPPPQEGTPGCMPGLPCIPKPPGEDLINNGGLGAILTPRARIKIYLEN